MKINPYNTDARLIHADNWVNTGRDIESWRRSCGCIKTSDKLKQILHSFPAPPPPSNVTSGVVVTRSANTTLHPTCEHPLTCISAYCNHTPTLTKDPADHQLVKYDLTTATAAISPHAHAKPKPPGRSKPYRVVSELVSLVQLSVTATALALYYLLYCYMQLIYYTLRSALYFHNADGPMKITIAVVTLTSILIGFNVIVRIERMTGYLPSFS